MALGKELPKFWSRKLHKKLIMRITPVIPPLGERDRRIPGLPGQHVQLVRELQVQ